MNKEEIEKLINSWVHLELSTLKMFEIFNLNYLNTRTNKILHKDTLKLYLRNYLELLGFNLEWLKDQFKNRKYNKFINTISSPEYKKRRPEIYLKGLKTKLKNGSINTSKPEEEVKHKLEIKYNIVECQYYSKEYPFACDFYLPNLNLYIECDFHWTHDNHLFNPYDEKDIIKVNHFYDKAKMGSGFYKRALETWTTSDPLKHWYQTKNNLNFLRFYNLKEFNDWYTS